MFPGFFGLEVNRCVELTCLPLDNAQHIISIRFDVDHCNSSSIPQSTVSIIISVGPVADLVLYDTI